MYLVTAFIRLNKILSEYRLHLDLDLLFGCYVCSEICNMMLILSVLSQESGESLLAEDAEDDAQPSTSAQIPGNIGKTATRLGFYINANV